MAKRKSSMNGIPDRSLMVHAIGLPDLTGRSVAVVGGTDGLGRAIARLAAEQGADVLVVGRTFRDEGLPRLRFLKADLSSMKEATRIGDELPAELDAVLFTTGIIAAPTREVTSEGIERDMAVSTLSRHAILNRLGPRLRAGARVFVMGFPGAGNLGDPDDLNAERAYQPMPVHMNTVAGNEALVLDARDRYPQLLCFGLNPGMVKTGIRSNFLGAGSLKHRVVEALIGLMTPTPEAYARGVLPLMTASELTGRSGAMFGKKATAILPTDGMDATRVAQYASSLDGLLARARA